MFLKHVFSSSESLLFLCLFALLIFRTLRHSNRWWEREAHHGEGKSPLSLATRAWTVWNCKKYLLEDIIIFLMSIPFLGVIMSDRQRKEMTTEFLLVFCDALIGHKFAIKWKLISIPMEYLCRWSLRLISSNFNRSADSLSFRMQLDTLHKLFNSHWSFSRKTLKIATSNVESRSLSFQRNSNNIIKRSSAMWKSPRHRLHSWNFKLCRALAYSELMGNIFHISSSSWAMELSECRPVARHIVWASNN